MSSNSIACKALDQGKGIVRLAPNWVPRSFCVPGRRIKLHPDDYYALGGERGGIDERWFASTTPADNGPLTSKDEGLSFTVFEDGKIEKDRLIDAIGELKAEIMGGRPYTFFGLNRGTAEKQGLRSEDILELPVDIPVENLWNRGEDWAVDEKVFKAEGAWARHIDHGAKHSPFEIRLGKPKPFHSRSQLSQCCDRIWSSTLVLTCGDYLPRQDGERVGELPEIAPVAVKSRHRHKKSKSRRDGPSQRNSGGQEDVSRIEGKRSKGNVREVERKKPKRRPFIRIKREKIKRTTIELGPSFVNLVRHLPWPLNLPFRRLLNQISTD